MKILKLLLVPFSLLYGLGVWIRNLLYDWNILKSTAFDFPVIGVGNLAVGGTGKTPVTEYLVRLFLAHDLKPAVLSRGYRRKTSGFHLVETTSTARETGDEPLQIKKKFPGITVAVCEKRVKGVKRLLAEQMPLDVIILDDAFQHRAIKPGINILLTEYSHPFTQRWLLPAGRLREGKNARKRADIIVVTKNPIVLSPFEERRLQDIINPFDYQEVYFSYIHYRKIKKIFPEQNYGIEENADQLKRYSILLFTGIVNPTPLQYYLERHYKEVFLVKFADHHAYKDKDMDKIITQFQELYNPNKFILTTEKDFSRLRNSRQLQALKDFPAFYLPIDINFHQYKKTTFDKHVLNFTMKNKKQNNDIRTDRGNRPVYQE